MRSPEIHLHATEATMSAPRTAEQEALAHERTQDIHQAADDDIRHIARMLVATDERHLFGNTEFKIRAVVLKIAAKAYAAHLAGKKTATRATASAARTAGVRLNTTATAPVNS
jgi:hypothetical protein